MTTEHELEKIASGGFSDRDLSPQRQHVVNQLIKDGIRLMPLSHDRTMKVGA